MITKICLKCGKEFKVDISHKNNKFCSYECYWNSLKKNKLKLVCHFCGNSFEVKPCRKNALYCSSVCGFSSKERKNKLIRVLTGRKLSDFHKNNISNGLIGKMSSEKNPGWKGDSVGYMALHTWVRKRLGKPTKCEHCGSNGLTGKNIHWANKDHSYKRNLTDWIRLCVPCHDKYDILHELKKHNNQFKPQA